MIDSVSLRPARLADVHQIAALNNGFAAANQMLPRSPESIALAIDDYVVAVDARGRVMACGALKEYSPSLAEVSAVAVAKEAHGRGLGRAIVQQVEELARLRGIGEVIALTLTPQFFAALGYEVADRAHYPEKIRRDCLGCARRHACAEVCVRRSIAVERPSSVEAYEIAA